jgi:Family of unknown function (DUF6951)
MNATADVQAGICGHRTVLQAESTDGRAVTLGLETTCDNVRRLATRLTEHGPLDAYGEINPKGSSTVLALGHRAACCTDCIVPASALKALRVATRLALPADVAIELKQG